MASSPNAFGVLRLRDFRLLLAGKAVSVLGDRMVSVALAFAVLGIGGSASAVGLVLAAGTAPMALSVIAGGVVADRVPRRAVMVGADLLRLATQGATAVLLLTGTAEVWMLAALAAVTGVGSGFFNPASTGLLPEIVPPGDLQPANALRSSATAAGEIAGPVLAGVLVAVSSPGTAIAVDAGTFAVSAICLAAMRPPVREPRGGASFLADLRDGWTAFASRRWVWTFVSYFAFGNMMWAAWSALGPVVADRDLGGAAPWGVVLGAMGVGALAGGLAATRIDPARPLLAVAAMEGLFALPLAFLAAGTGVAVLVVAGFVSGVGLMVGMSVWESTLQRRIPGESLSRVSSYDWFGSFAFYPLGMALWGPIAAAIGLTPALWVAFGGFAIFIAAVLLMPETRRLRRDAATPPQVTPAR
ncbi:MAG TPA: MFS transporter [Capillimicrobium sp.]|nr:MFS transporter [Capillimicrobium sp.]